MAGINWRDVLERAAWTFVQGALSTVAVVPALTDTAGWKAVGIAAVAGGGAALVSFAKTFIQERFGVIETRD